jgi:hypothetical protein
MLWVLILFRRGVLDTTLCDKVCQWLAACQWFSPNSPVSSINITEILLKVALNTVTLTLNHLNEGWCWLFTHIKLTWNLVSYFTTWRRYVDIPTVSKILLYFFRATVNEVRLDNVYIDTCNSSGRVMDWSVMLETHHKFYTKKQKMH